MGARFEHDGRAIGTADSAVGAAARAAIASADTNAPAAAARTLRGHVAPAIGPRRLATLVASTLTLTLALAAPLAAQQPPALEPAAPVACELLADTDGDGRVELLVVTRAGLITRFALGDDGAFRALGTLQLADPAHSLLAIADVDGAPGDELVCCDSKGTSWLPFPSADGVARPAVSLARRARCVLALGQPQASSFAQDLDQDGRIDLLVPSLQGVTPFLQEAPAADGSRSFRALDRLVTPVRASADEPGPDREGRPVRERAGSFVVPRIETEDLDGDGKPDLLTREGNVHAFHLQDQKGGFRAPRTVDLAQFEDSTPKAAVAPGSTLVLGDRQLLQRGDVDGDGIPDFVIAHRRKVWTFLSSKEGPQFTKARTQAVADDVSAVLLADLDDDKKADLLAFQVQVPGIGALLLGLVQSIDIDIKAVGYRSEDGAFAGAPKWRRTITLRIPPILQLIGKQDELLAKVQAVASKARLGVRGAFTGKGRSDLALVRQDGLALDLHAMDGQAPTLASAAGRRLMRRVLFEDPNPVFDLDRVLTLVGGFLDEVSGGLVGDTPPVASAPVRDAKQWRLGDLLVGAFDGDGIADVIAVYDRVDDGSLPAKDLPLRAYERVRFAKP